MAVSENLLLEKFEALYGGQRPLYLACAPGRVNLIRRVVDKMAVILPFEVDFYRRYGMEVHFVGHPLLDVVKPHLDRATFCKLVNLDPERPLLGLFPGSRLQEVKTLFPVFREAYLRLKEEFPALQGVVVRAEGLSEGFYQPLAPDLHLVTGYQYEVMNQSEVVLLASGTVTLEAAIVGVPMVVAYRVPKITYFLARRLVKVPYISLVNLIAEEELVREFLQEEASAENLAQEASRFLSHPEESRLLRERLALLKGRLGSPGVAWRVAELALEFARQTIR